MDSKEKYYESNNIDRPNSKTHGIPTLEQFSFNRLVWYEKLKIGDFVDVIKGDLSGEEII